MIQRSITIRRVLLYCTTILTTVLMSLGGTSKAQSAPGMAAIEPYPGAPLCPTHNDSAWHGLWDYERGCHYNHTHETDPSTANGVFGDAGNLWGGQTVSYPWMTANENDQAGHNGYKYAVNLNPTPFGAQEGYNYEPFLSRPPNYVTAFRIQMHDIGGNAHVTKRFHSYYLEARIQSRNSNQTGIIRTGGWADFGCYHLNYKTEFLLFPGTDPTNPDGTDACGTTQSIHADPYHTSRSLEYLQYVNNAANVQFWTSHDRYGYNQMAYFFFRTLDGWGGVDRNDPYAEHLICPDLTCRYNASEHHVFTVFVKIPASLDTDNDGIVNYTGYTDRKGNIVQGCTTPGLDCVPLQIVNASVGTAIWSRNESPDYPGQGECVPDADIYFNPQGQPVTGLCHTTQPGMQVDGLKPSGWIEFPNHSHNPAPTNTPMSSPSGPFVSTEVNPTSVNVGGTASASIVLNNVPAEGYKSAEFTCTYNTYESTGSVEISSIVPTTLFGLDPVVAIHDPQNGTFIAAIAGTNGNRATTTGPAFTFNVKGLQAGQSKIQCTSRVSKGDNIPIDLPSTGTTLAILGTESSPTPPGAPTSTPGDHEHPTPTNTPFVESPTPISPTEGSLTGQVVASKPVTLNLLDANGATITSLPANPDGTFSLTALAGNYTLVATASGFLSHQGSVTINAGNTTAKPMIHLLAGDVDGNAVIDQFDALTIGMSYTTSSPAAADLNNDGVIDFLDLELMSENYRQIGPSVWE